MKTVLLTIIVLIFLCSCKKMFTNTHIEGIVYNSIDNQPLKGVEVGVFKESGFGVKKISDQTNNDGEFQIDANLFNEFELVVISKIEKIENNQYETHEYVCLDSIECKDKFLLNPEDESLVEFHLVPTGKLSFRINNVSRDPDIDKIEIFFPNSWRKEQRYFSFNKSEINDSYSGNTIFGQNVTYIADQQVQLIVTIYKDGSLIKTISEEIFIDKWKSKPFLVEF